MITRAAEVKEKLARIRSFLDRADLDGALFTRQALVAWATAGIEDAIVRGEDPGLVWALVTRDGAYLITQNVEAPRLAAEEGPAEIGFEVVTFPWEEQRWSGVAGELCDPARLAGDGHGAGRPMAAELQQLRLVLTGPEKERLTLLGAEAAEALETAVRAVRRGQTELELAARLAELCELERIFPSVLLVGADDRHMRFRHPTPSATKIERDVLAVIVGVRGGLNVALTRTASLGPTDPTLAARHAAACEVETRMIAASRPGATWGEALQAGLDAYGRLGFPGEWRHHYQGGPIGYGSREFGPAPLEQPNAFTHYPVLENQAAAWSPSIQGAKSEDTFIVELGGNRFVTNTESWPVVAGRPAILELQHLR